MKTILKAAILGAGVFAAAAAVAWAEPTFDAKGQLQVPADIAMWPELGVTVAMSYQAEQSTTVNTVRLDPASMKAYLATGEFPKGAMLNLEIRRQAQAAADSLIKSGGYAGPVVAYSMHVKDEKAGPGTWTFYAWSSGETAGRVIPRTAACYTCHAEHAKQDTVFTQFYPILAEERARSAKPAN